MTISIMINIIEKINKAIQESYEEKSKINQDIIDLNGMSTPKVRHLLNNILQNFNSYLEVGSYEGSTLCSAIYKNNLKNIYAFENFSESFGTGAASREKLLNNIDKYKNSDVNLIEKDFFNADLSKIRDIEVYFYDGIHRAETQYWHFDKIKDSLARYSLIIIDDFYCDISYPKLMSFTALKDFGYKIHYYWELPPKEYHGGLGLFLVEK